MKALLTICPKMPVLKCPVWLMVKGYAHKSRRAAAALAALMQTNINVQQLTVEALTSGKREHVYHAAMLDPHTAAELTLDQIWALVDEMLAAHGAAIPELR